MSSRGGRRSACPRSHTASRDCVLKLPHTTTQAGLVLTLSCKFVMKTLHAALGRCIGRVPWTCLPNPLPHLAQRPSPASTASARPHPPLSVLRAEPRLIFLKTDKNETKTQNPFYIRGSYHDRDGPPWASCERDGPMPIKTSGRILRFHACPKAWEAKERTT